jgi:hypothetical protein
MKSSPSATMIPDAGLHGAGTEAASQERRCLVFFYAAMTLISASLVGCCIFLMNRLCDSWAAGVVMSALVLYLFFLWPRYTPRKWERDRDLYD